MGTTIQEDYRRAVNPNLPDDDQHETKRVRPVRIPRNEKWIYSGMALVILIDVLGIAVKNGWL